MKKTLEGKVALVAGATRGAGRAIAATLGEAGATVYCSSRSTRGSLPNPKRPETIEDTAELVSARGGVGIAVRTDHTVPAEVKKLIARIKKEQGQLDILINNVNGDDLIEWKPFWKLRLDDVLRGIERGIHANIITTHFAAPLMIAKKRGLIAGITDGDGVYYRGAFLYDIEKTHVIRFAAAMAIELRKYDITSVAITPGFIRSEQVLEVLQVKEENWRDAIPNRPEFMESETPFFVARGLVALAADPNMLAKTGRVYNSYLLSQEYGFRDVDGRQPNIWDWFGENMPQHNFRRCDDGFYEYVWGRDDPAR